MSEGGSVALIVGVTGMAGLSIAEALKSPTALGGPWEVIGSSRRPKLTWFPQYLLDQYLTFDAVNSSITKAALSPLSCRVTHLFWVALYAGPTESDNISVNSAMLTNVLDALTTTRTSALRHVTVQTGTKHYMGPINDPVISAQLGPPEIPFREDSPRLPYPNFYYSLEDVAASYTRQRGERRRLTYSVHRSSIIVGASTRSVYNLLLTLAVYAEICKREAAPFRFPGTRYGWEHLCDITDARVLAQQHVWAAMKASEGDGYPDGGGEAAAFNCTNGDVFTWKAMWRVLSDALAVEFVELPDEDGLFDLAGYIEGKAEVWDRIVEEKGLVKTKLDEVTCAGALQLVTRFGFQHVSSMNKSRECGFFGFVDSFRSVRFWVQRLRDMKIIP